MSQVTRSPPAGGGGCWRSPRRSAVKARTRAPNQIGAFRPGAGHASVTAAHRELDALFRLTSAPARTAPHVVGAAAVASVPAAAFVAAALRPDQHRAAGKLAPAELPARDLDHRSWASPCRCPARLPMWSPPLSFPFPGRPAGPDEREPARPRPGR